MGTRSILGKAFEKLKKKLEDRPLNDLFEGLFLFPFHFQKNNFPTI